MSLKLTDLQKASQERFPDWVLDAEDEKGQQMELHFRPILALPPERREEIAAFQDAFRESKDEAQIIGAIRGIFEALAQDPYHFEVLDKYIDGDVTIWVTVLELYSKHAQMGEA